jgi:protein-S-isoprenylcysteine O-methyltransferase Ste14
MVVWAMPPDRLLADANGGSWGIARWLALAFDTGLYGIFAMHHSLFARELVKSWLARVIPPQLVRSVYVWIASLLFAAMCLAWQRIGGDLYLVSGWPAVALAAVQALGLGFLIWSVRAIDPLELAGIRPQPPAGRLQTAGPYRLVRHPLYLGFVLFVAGPAHMTVDRLSFAIMTLAYLVIAIPWEERALGGTFGDAYLEYTRRVRWRLVPYVY